MASVQWPRKNVAMHLTTSIVEEADVCGASIDATTQHDSTHLGMDVAWIRWEVGGWCACNHQNEVREGGEKKEEERKRRCRYLKQIAVGE